MKLHVKSASFSTDNGQTSRMSIFYCVSNHKNLNLTYLDNALTYRFRLNLRNIEAAIGGKSYRERFWKNSSQCREMTAASKIVNSVISLLWQLRCHCNPDHYKFSSLSNTTVMAIFPNLCLWRRGLCSNLGGTDPEKLYRATLIR